MPVRHEVDPARLRPNDAPETRGSHERFTAATGWEPVIPLGDTVRDTLALVAAGGVAPGELPRLRRRRCRPGSPSPRASPSDPRRFELLRCPACGTRRDRRPAARAPRPTSRASTRPGRRARAAVRAAAARHRRPARPRAGPRRPAPAARACSTPGAGRGPAGGRAAPARASPPSGIDPSGAAWRQAGAAGLDVARRSIAEHAATRASTPWCCGTWLEHLDDPLAALDARDAAGWRRAGWCCSACPTPRRSRPGSPAPAWMHWDARATACTSPRRA